jgi:hypothetical protein
MWTRPDKPGRKRQPLGTVASIHLIGAFGSEMAHCRNSVAAKTTFKNGRALGRFIDLIEIANLEICVG